jgi:sporulation protein YlmC with PRC-barrel domain
MVLGRVGKAMKDSALSVGLKVFFNDKFGEYGEVRDCSVDTNAGRITAHVLMRGESAPITVTIERYELEQDKGKTYIVIRRLATSRQWITLLLNRVLDGRRFEVPSSVSKVL